MKIIPCRQRDAATLEKLFEIWESAVRETHLFLSENDISRLAPIVKAALKNISILMIALDENNEPAGFMGIDKDCLEMLFIAPDRCGIGLGRQMIELAVQKFGIRRVDVNEQNPEARGFYEHVGFEVKSRSETDDYGNPFPILHMVWRG